MDEPSAEMTKYAANSYLATRITFMNEIANLCEKLGANVDFVRKGMGTDGRIGSRFLFSGIGYGGSCFPKDVQALAKTASENQYDFSILNAVMAVNNHQKIIMMDKIKSVFGDDLSGKTFAVWGLAFKPNTDDIREAPALYMIDELLAAGAKVVAYDPEAMENVKQTYANRITFASNQYEAVQGADALLIATEWTVFRSPNFAKMEELMTSKTIFDGRNLYNLKQMQDLNWYYASIGRQTITN